MITNLARNFIDPGIVKRVEIVHGGGSTLQRLEALGSSVSIQAAELYYLIEEDDQGHPGS